MIRRVLAPVFALLSASPIFAQTAPIATTAIKPVNYIVGTQTVGASYQFTTQSKLRETAQAILGMGSNVIKFAMGPDYVTYGDSVAKDSKIRSLVELARDEPSVRHVLDMPFTNYVIWTYCFSPGKLDQNLTQDQLAAEYTEIYDLTRYLLTTYDGTGKTFYLGHWEGDWTLLYWSGFTKLDHNENPTPKAILAMIAWLNTRQKAVDDAKRDTPHNGVNVYHYSEVNLITTKAMEGGTTVINDVIPHTDVDYVSYSAYDSIHQNDIPGTLTAALDYIATKLPPKPSIAGRRVFIGEYGFPARTFSPRQQDAKAKQVILAALRWGTPFVLYWEFYNNEVTAEGQVGYWLVDDKNVKQAVYDTFQQYYAAADDFVTQFQKDKGRSPDNGEFRAFAHQWFVDAAKAESRN